MRPLLLTAFGSAFRSIVIERRMIGLAMTAAVAAFAHCGVARASVCADIVPPAPALLAQMPKRHITAVDLARLRDLSRDVSDREKSFALSPDGKTIAFTLQQADPASNRYCIALMTMDLNDRNGHVKVLDTSDEFVPLTYERDGLGDQHNGFTAALFVRWSSDGKSLALLRRENGITQVRVVASDGSNARTVTHSPVDVENFVWGQDGRTIIWSSRVGIARKAAQVDAEALRGFHYDRRFMPSTSNRPRLDAPLEVFSERLNDETTRPANARERRRLYLRGERDANIPNAVATAFSKTGEVAYTFSPDPANIDAPISLCVLAQPDANASCPKLGDGGNVSGVWWGESGNDVYFLREEGWSNASYAMYRWIPGRGAPKKLWSTDDLLTGCDQRGRLLICAEESATQPRRLVWLDPRSGKQIPLFDPNPEFRSFRFGAVQRFRWKNDLGFEAFGDLVLPPGFNGSYKLPLVVVGYQSRGFLRGGTGDEYPIFPLAAQGFAVLSFDRPESIGHATAAVNTTSTARNAANLRDLADRRNANSALVRGISILEDRGIIDRTRIGITGFSDGAAAVQYALLNTDMFAAAAVSNCCMDRRLGMIVGGPLYASHYQKEGVPPVSTPGWPEDKRMSIVQHAHEWHTPLLIQDSDTEYMFALRSVQALREFDAPVEMYVFPGEYHLKWQSAHRLAVYRRNLDWFDFWLRGVKRPDESGLANYSQWERWKARARAVHSGADS